MRMELTMRAVCVVIALLLMQYDSTIRITDIIMIAAIVVGPIAAVWVAESRRKFHDRHERRVRVFRTLMATRLSILAVPHVESLNLVELEFQTSNPQDKKVVDCWKMYLSHLNNAPGYIPREGWEQRRHELLI